jgi:hypothetical protein
MVASCFSVWILRQAVVPATRGSKAYAVSLSLEPGVIQGIGKQRAKAVGQKARGFGQSVLAGINE